MSSLIVDVTTIKEIHPHPNADKLELATIKGWTVVTQKAKYKPGDTVVYVPPDSILPQELSDRLDVTKYLSKQRVRSIKLRGVVSCGMIIENEGNWPIGTNLIDHYGITKWEPPPTMGGECVQGPENFYRYTDIENWNNYPDIFKDGEEVIITEKIHGTNWRAGLINGEFYVGSHNTVKKFDENNLYWQAAIKYKIEDRLRECYKDNESVIVYGEIYGRIQDLKYGLGNDYDIKLFDINFTDYLGNNIWLDKINFTEIVVECLDMYSVPILYEGPYSVNLINKLCQGKSTLTNDHIREGIVIKPIQERWDPVVGRVILKKINPEYLVRKEGSEYH